MSVHVDVTWYGCPICHLIWPDNRLCCELTEDDPPVHELEWRTFTGVTLTEWSDLPDDNPGGMHPGITRFSCDMLEGVTNDPHHLLHRAAYLVTFDSEDVEPMHICYTCASNVFGVVKVAPE